MSNKRSRRKPSRKTLPPIESLYITALIAVVAGILIIAFSPNRKNADTRNAQRMADITTILNAVDAYALDNLTLPSTISPTVMEICATDASDCTGLIDLSSLTAEKKYLPALPTDPDCKKLCKPNHTGYSIARNSENQVVVSAIYAENRQILSVSH